ncbi:MAG: cache domain-containing protein [Rhodospirillum sp.]|nr:cache domain-containing protein [Rhodospirillum sp.]MCF8487697.1 cache domain-containing protein [Rhodospirillum sp.]MCF8499593.1 cache domain-containing protein [Rhodospirillum sp.]
MERKLSISTIFTILSLVTLLGIGALSITSATTTKATMLEDRQDKIKQIILGVTSVANAVLERQREGNLTEEQAHRAILDYVQNFRFDGNNYIFAITYDFCVLAHVKVKDIGSCDQKPQRVIFNDLAKQGGGFHRYKTVKAGSEGDHFDKMSYVHPIPEMNMYIGTGVYFDDIEDAFVKILIRSATIGVITIAVIALIGFLVGKSVSRTLRTLSMRMEDLTQGKLDVAFNFKNFVKEIDSIIESVGILSTKLVENRKLEQDKVLYEEKAKEDRRKATLTLANHFDDSVGHIVSSVKAAAEDLDRTAVTMSRKSKSAEDSAIAVAAAAEEASQNTATVAAATEELSTSIAEIASQVQKAAEVAQRAVHESRTTNERVSGLATAVDKVGEVVTLITDIANQTNLLALNATIEAARAGEMGKGFAVVASEVKNLANQTARATDEIAQQITTIQTETRLSVTAIENIGGTIETINSISAAIAAAVEEQGMATQEISRGVQQASRGTDQVSENISGVHQAAEEAASSASNVRQSATDLLTLANTLGTQVKGFLDGVRAS